MNTVTQIRTLLTTQLEATRVDIEDQSHQHAGHAGRQDPLSSGGHYTVTVVSPQFEHRSSIERHRLVYGILSTEMGQRIHALSIRAYTPSQWEHLQHKSSLL